MKNNIKNRNCDFCEKMRKNIQNYSNEYMEKMKKIREIFDLLKKIKNTLYNDSQARKIHDL
jgi:hypothetical protein